MTTATDVPRHPAKWHKGALELSRKYLLELLPPRPLVLDPFAGVGGIHDLRPDAITVGLELEPEWAAAHPGTVAGDVLAMPAEWSGKFRAVVSSPCYGNRMADNHNARDLCKTCRGEGTTGDPPRPCAVCKGERYSRRNTYKHALGRDPSPGSSAVMQWGEAYRRFHRSAFYAVLDVLEPAGLIVWNVKNHYRTLVKGEPEVEQLVSEWHLVTWLELGAHLHAVERLDAGGIRQGANYGARTDAEFLMILRAP